MGKCKLLLFKQDSGSLQRIGELESLVSQQESQLQEYRHTLSRTVSPVEVVHWKLEVQVEHVMSSSCTL